MSRFKFGAIVLISLGAIFFSDVGKEGGYFPQDSGQEWFIKEYCQLFRCASICCLSLLDAPFFLYFRQFCFLHKLNVTEKQTYSSPLDSLSYNGFVSIPLGKLLYSGLFGLISTRSASFNGVIISASLTYVFFLGCVQAACSLISLYFL